MGPALRSWGSDTARSPAGRSTFTSCNSSYPRKKKKIVFHTWSRQRQSVSIAMVPQCRWAEKEEKNQKQHLLWEHAGFDSSTVYYISAAPQNGSWLAGSRFRERWSGTPWKIQQPVQSYKSCSAASQNIGSGWGEVQRDCCGAGLDSLRDICVGKEGDVELEQNYVGAALKPCSLVLLE